MMREEPTEPTAIKLDYDSHPERWNPWQPQQDMHEIVARELSGPTLDVGCGDGRLASHLGNDVSWVGLDSSPTQLAAGTLSRGPGTASMSRFKRATRSGRIVVITPYLPERAEVADVPLWLTKRGVLVRATKA